MTQETQANEIGRTKSACKMDRNVTICEMMINKAKTKRNKEWTAMNETVWKTTIPNFFNRISEQSHPLDTNISK